MTLTEIKQTLAARGLRPLKQFGQNFLHDQNLCLWIARAAVEGAPPAAQVLEIGPGLGALTGPLREFGHPILALEKDRGLAGVLRARFEGDNGFVLREGDALELLPELESLPRYVAGNLPYNISTPLLMACLERPDRPLQMTFTLQKEIVQRLASGSHSEDYSALTVLVQTFYRVENLRTIGGNVFYPAPEVDSAVVRLHLLETPRVEAAEYSAFRDFVKRGFSQRRKKLSNLLPVQDDRRAEHLGVEDWVTLFRSTRI
jgi:16S rRNA (adenine1518-N6/adenine1519-N6)-dimethyltransferase